MNRHMFLLAVALWSVARAALGQEATLQDAARALDAGPEVVIYTAREIVTLAPTKPVVTAGPNTSAPS